MPYIPHDRFHDYFDKFSVKELQEYMRNLLIALKHVHDFNVIHRDVKPSNFLHDRQNHKYLLVDFGLAQELDSEYDNKQSMNACILSNNKTNDEIMECDKKAIEQLPQSCQPMDEDDCEMELNAANNQDNGISRSNKRKPPNSDETENKCSSIETNPPKRQRIGNASMIPGIDNTSQHSSYIPSHFKTPLKQMNEISMKKTNKQTDIELNSPLTAEIKSAIVGYSIHSKITNDRGNLKSVSPASNQSPANGIPKRNPSINITPPNHKYHLDNRSTGNNVKCFCYGRPTVCNVCLIKREIQATRAGTPGYRPSEVLLKYPNQTTAVDVWAAGVILISILSGCYPFFKSTDDFTALAEIITVFGDEIVKKTAYALGRHVCISRKKRPLHLRKLCIRLRNRCNMPNTQTSENTNSTNSMEYCDNCEQMNINCLCQHTDFNADFSNDIYPDSVYDLLTRLLAINPLKRISAKDALQHPFFQEIH